MRKLRKLANSKKGKWFDGRKAKDDYPFVYDVEASDPSPDGRMIGIDERALLAYLVEAVADLQDRP